jgi:hypothetical protein
MRDMNAKKSGVGSEAIIADFKGTSAINHALKPPRACLWQVEPLF